MSCVRGQRAHRSGTGPAHGLRHLRRARGGKHQDQCWSLAPHPPKDLAGLQAERTGLMHLVLGTAGGSRTR
ncbi:hypothetical protein Y1Q_0001252 [Alligator mississippiensis]|uniref:Uncharacterized protein n=1 Tax=Alligator mississippiensis TaxID=8496 RepID=A0A151M8S9_ALLMI|nr:hypothetical protein Y1Q_0001252 [Alligator mississippiensis]